MIGQNEYFEGQVRSLEFKNEQGNFTVGVMEPGEWKFEAPPSRSGCISCAVPGMSSSLPVRGSGPPTRKANGSRSLGVPTSRSV